MPNTKEFAIECCGVHFAYRKRQVLCDIDFSVPHGNFVAILGANGSGKTTLLRLISRVLLPSKGSVRVLGEKTNDWNVKALSQKIAVVPQKFELSFPFCVQEVVLMGRIPHRSPLAMDSRQDISIARKAMEATAVSSLSHRRMEELSGGEFKRVVVAKALAQQPVILLMDEPAAHLDIRHQVGLIHLIKEIQSETCVTVIAAMHDLNLAAAFCDQIVLLKDGHILKAGSVENVMTYHALSDAFQTDIYVGVNDLTGHRLFTPLIRPTEKTPQEMSP